MIFRQIKSHNNSPLIHLSLHSPFTIHHSPFTIKNGFVPKAKSLCEEKGIGMASKIEHY